MANRILKGLAVAAGTGLAMGFTTGRSRVRIVRSAPATDRDITLPFPENPVAENPDDEFLNIEPLLDRLERLEARVDAMGRQQPPAPYSSPAATPDGALDDYAAALADLDRRVEENTRELALLREHVNEAERHMTASVASVHRSVEQTRGELPAVVERHVSARIEDLRSHFAAELEQSHHRMMEMFEHAIDEKVSSRIGSIERALEVQAESIEVLSTRTTETDSNLQRLVAAIEKLCERAQLIAPLAVHQSAKTPPFQESRQYEPRLPFESQLNDAMRREPVVPVLRNEEPAAEVKVPAPAFTGSGAPAPKKSRFLFRNLIVAGLSVLASRLFR